MATFLASGGFLMDKVRIGKHGECVRGNTFVSISAHAHRLPHESGFVNQIGTCMRKRPLAGGPAFEFRVPRPSSFEGRGF